MALRDDFSSEAKDDLFKTIQDLIANPMEFTPGQCSSAMRVVVDNKEDKTAPPQIAIMHCHLIYDHEGNHEHYGHNKSTWFWKDD